MRKINDLLYKYYEGESTLEEEAELREYFQLNNVSSELSILKAQFDFYKTEGNRNRLNSDFDEKIINEILSRKVFGLAEYFQTSWFKVASIAAGLLLVLGLTMIFYYNNPSANDNKISISTEEQFAYEQTVEALIKASKYINKANLELEKISIINESTEALDNINYIEKYKKYLLNILGEES